MKIGESVIAHYKGEYYNGVITGVLPNYARVKFDCDDSEFWLLPKDVKILVTAAASIQNDFQELRQYERNKCNVPKCDEDVHKACGFCMVYLCYSHSNTECYAHK